MRTQGKKFFFHTGAAEMSSSHVAGHIQDDTDLIFADEVIAFTAPVNTSFLKKAV